MRTIFRKTASLALILIVTLLWGNFPAIQAQEPGFVTVEDGQFVLDGEPLTFAGTNFWMGMLLGIDGPDGDRERLAAELDQLKELGLTNLRVMASSEGPNTEPFRMVPALMLEPGVYDETVFDGLDWLIAEIGQRDMHAVMVLNNYWQWSGGMAQYVSWAEESAIPYPGDWNQFMAYSARFYVCEECQEWYRAHIQTVIERENPYTGLVYRDDPAIFAWELANEPRSYPPKWIDDTAAFIKSLDPNHMVTTGSEGGLPWGELDFTGTHDGPDIDYATLHIWPQNWGWYDPANQASYPFAEQAALAYLRDTADQAAALGKPLVLEEFGLARDWEPLRDIYDPASPTTYRDLFYTALFAEAEALAADGGPVQGTNFWAWGGRGRPDDGMVGDPPHEPPGWYSVYDTDTGTLEVIEAHASVMNTIGR